MSYRFVVRPPTILTTPQALATALGARKAIKSCRTGFDFNRDFFMFYPDRSLSVPEELTSFTRKNKYGQRRIIQNSGIRTPEYYSSGASRFVVRPLRHMGGAGFRITEDGSDYDLSSEYISPFFDKQWEYRLVYVKGRHCLTLYKRVNEGTSSDVPWNHACGSTFVTTDNWDACRLRHTSILEDLARSPIINQAHIVAVDVMLRKERGGDWQYAVCEFNFCPSLTIEGNLAKVVEYAS